jgi:serine protease Do
MNGVDLARFEFDYDTTWQAFFLDADLNIYSRYGGRDEESTDGRHSKESLLTTMREVLEVHQRRQERAKVLPRIADDHQKKGRGFSGAAETGSPNASPDAGAHDIDKDLHPPPGKPTTPEDIPLLKRNHHGCVHCHQVQEFRILQAFFDKSFSREQLFGFPLPENIGIRFDRRHGHKIEAVIPGSAAEKAGLLAGDVVTRANDVPIHSEQDVRWALHRAAENDKPMITVLRGATDAGSLRSIRVEVAPQAGWRQTELSWRRSLRSVPFPVGCLAYPLGSEERHKAGLPDGRLAIKVLSIRGSGLATSVGLLKGDLIVGQDGRQSSRSFEEFKSDLLRRYSPGDVVRLTVLRDGETVELSGPFPDWHTTNTSVP